MKKIIIPTDFSENAYNAIAYAMQLLKDEDCTFYLLNTYTPVLYNSEYMYYTPTMSLDDIYKSNSVKGLERTKKRIKKEFKNPKHQFETLSFFSFLTGEINELVEKKNIDLVIMGTQGATGAKEVLFGTQTIHVIKKATCPVLAIPSDYEFKPLKNILLPSDFSIGFNENQLQVLRYLANLHHSTLHILHILQKNELSENQESGKHFLSKYFKSVTVDFHLKKGDDIQEVIMKFQKENPVEILSMINNKHSFFENLFFEPVVHKVGFHVNIPFLVIPSGKYSMRSIPVNIMR
ncbi:universal stress protein [uncultured Planktosalinus sp.]|uniref:universal stress protein n=1 Tax=uncultured Planktosalinus sp. TaxID=1810935 RepID=UPI0030DBC011